MQPRPVEVRHEDGNWYPGWVEAQQRREDGWWGFVRYTIEPGLQHLQWVHETRIRLRE